MKPLRVLYLHMIGPFGGASRSLFAALEERPAATPARPQAFAFLGQRYEEPEAPAARIRAESAGYGARPSRTEIAAVEPEPESRIASGVPLPPERPFDLGTIPNAGVPVPVASLAPMPPSRPVFAGLYYAPPEAPRARFARSDPFKDMTPQRFVALKAVER